MESSACLECDAPTVSFAVPEEYREDFLSVIDSRIDKQTAWICTRCLTIGVSDESTPDPDFTRISEAFPRSPERAIPIALVLGLCSSLATNNNRIESLFRDVERSGIDPLLTIDRILDDPSISPAVDLDRRRHQLEQLLY